MNSIEISVNNRAFLFGDAVQVHFFVRNGDLIFSEDCYFFLMASMRKMRMKIPLTYTLEAIEKLLNHEIKEKKLQNAFLHFLVFRGENSKGDLTKSEVGYHIQILEKPNDLLSISGLVEMDFIKEITVNTNFLSSIYTHSTENIYAEIYAKDNDLGEAILLNKDKRIARSTFGNLLFLEQKTIKIPKQSEGAYISPLLERFVTFVHQNQLATIEEAELSAFESQKADEILLISDAKGIFGVSKIRNKNFENQQFTEMLQCWKQAMW